MLRILLAATVIASAVVLSAPTSLAVGGTIVVADVGTGNVGAETSITLDASGNPVISYYDVALSDLKIVHCNDPNCAGGDETINAADTFLSVGRDSSIQLDASGNPVVSYRYVVVNDLRILHCDDPNCAPGGDSVTTPDETGSNGIYTSLKLDASGNPVVSYHESIGGDLRLMHCNDPDCADGDDSIVIADGASTYTGQFTSLDLDASGNPVVSYYEFNEGAGDLRLLHCNDPYCTGNDESQTSPDTTNDTGWSTSIKLDSAGYPTISYLDRTTGDVKLMHCNDADCAGSDELIVTLDPTGSYTFRTSLALDASGNPAVSYFDPVAGELKLARCDDADCTGGGETVEVIDAFRGYVGYDALALDASGRPVVSYYREESVFLGVAHCNDVQCTGSDESLTAADRGDGDVGAYSSLKLDSVGHPVVAYKDETDDVLRVLHCNDKDCLGGDESITLPNSGILYSSVSLALDSAGKPVIAYLGTGGLTVMHCNDPNCAGNDESVATPDASGGSYASLALDADGNPVVAHVDGSNYLFDDQLKVLHCNDPNCAGSDESITSPDGGMHVVAYPSLQLNAGRPVVSFYGGTVIRHDGGANLGQLTVLTCDDINCDGIGESISAVDSNTNSGLTSSLALASGRPVVSYYDGANGNLKVLRCDDALCAGGGESITSPDTAGVVGQYTSLALDGASYPVVSYYDATNSDFKVMHCNDTNCAGGGEDISTLDSAGDVGRYTSLALRLGRPVVSFYDLTAGDLKLLVPNLPDADGDGCADEAEQQTAPGSETSGGRRDYLNPHDYFNPTHDGQNRVDDILVVVNQYHKDDTDGNPGLPPYIADYDPDTDRTTLGPNAWNLGPPNGQQRVDDILNAVYQYQHDCA